MCGISIYSGNAPGTPFPPAAADFSTAAGPRFFFFFSSEAWGFASGKACHLMVLPSQPWCSILQSWEVVR